MAKAAAIEGISAEDSYGEVAARVVSVRTRELAEHSRGVLDTADTERVHAMRVATRRLRAALEVFESCFPPKAYRQALKEVKRLADGLGERRDRDVAIATLAGFSEQMHAPDRKGVQSLIDQLRDEQKQANVDLAPMVDRDRLSGITERLEELSASARGQAQ
jgi:CHAD domain-containing protein